jgi:Holliday junction resolvase RusA-like endonuclease
MGEALMQVELPFPPSVNHYYRHVGPRTLISREGRAFRVTVCAILARLGVRRMSGPLAVTVEVYPPDNRRRDLDNVQKSLLDALQHGGAYGDDSQIARLLSERREAVPGGKVVVTVEEKR